MSLTIGSVATGYGGLDAAAAHIFRGAELAWVADNDPDVSKELAYRFPGVPNLGDITKVDWATVAPVDIFCAGFPCQDVSAAGLRKGIAPGTRSGLWLYIVTALSVLRPRFVVLENVLGLLSAPAHSDVESCPLCMGDSSARRLRALGAVLGDLAGLGFDAEWQVVSAADAGSCHQRKRVFILAWPSADGPVAADPGRDARAQDDAQRPALAGGS